MTTTVMPATFDSLSESIRRLGVKPEVTLIVHSALGRVGATIGGPATILEEAMSHADSRSNLEAKINFGG